MLMQLFCIRIYVSGLEFLRFGLFDQNEGTVTFPGEQFSALFWKWSIIMISGKKIQTATLPKRNHDFILNMEIS